MKRLTAIVAVTAALFALSVTPVDAQNGFDLSEVPRLGYQIDPTEGNVGDDVHSNVNTDDINEHCWDNNISGLSLEEMLEGFMTGQISLEQMLSTVGFEVLSYVAPSSTYHALATIADAGGYTVQEAQEAWEALYGPVPDRNPIQIFVEHSQTQTPPAGIPDDADGQTFVNRVGGFFTTAFGSFGVGELVPQLYPNLFITTFVDPVTQEMVGEMGNFDPGTGQGTMAVPDLDAGLYAVAAACVFFPTPEQFMATWDDGLVNAWNHGIECTEAGGEHCFPPPGGAQASADWAAEGGLAALLSPILAPRAIGIDFYCILQDDGTCATPPGPPPALTAITNGNGTGETPPGDGGGLPAADAVTAGPSFTG